MKICKAVHGGYERDSDIENALLSYMIERNLLRLRRVFRFSDLGLIVFPVVRTLALRRLLGLSKAND